MTLKQRVDMITAPIGYKIMNEQDLDLDNLDNLLEDFDGVTVEGGVDSENDDGCEGGACKI